MKSFIQDFVAKKGIWVGASLFVSRISSFLISLFGARMLTMDEFGAVTFVLNFLGIFLAISGFGAAQGVLKYGPTISDQKEKERFFSYAFSYGLLYNFVLTAIMFLIAGLLYWDEHSKIYLIALFFIRFLGFYLSEQKKAEYRANLDNESYAKLDILISVFSLILSLILTYFWHFEGFILSLVVAPFSYLLFDRKFNLSFKSNHLQNFNKKEFWKFSSTTALTTQVGELVFILDIFFIGWLMTDADVAHYKVSAMIPMNILVLGFIFMQTEYPKLCQHHKDKKYQHQFVFNYLKLFSVVGIIIYAIGYFFNKQILEIFGKQYADTTIYNILLLAAVMSLIFRVLFVYMLASIGKSTWNLKISVLMLVATSLALYFVIPKFGLIGVAYITFGCLTLSGILPAIAYFYESKKLS